MSELQTEQDVVRSLAGQAVTLDELYEACERAGVTGRDDGHTVIHSRTDTRWKRRVRSHLQTLKRTGRAQHMGDATWVIEGSRERPRLALLIIADDPSDVTLILGAAADVLDEVDEPFDLIVADPPWGLNLDGGGAGEERIERAYARDSSMTVGGYVDVPAELYAEFTEEWVGAAAGALRPGGYLAVVTGPQAAARAQITAEGVGLTYLNTIVVKRPFALRCTRKYAFSHTTITVLCNGPERSAKRTFFVPDDIRKARSGVDYPLDVWDDIPQWGRTGLRYPNGGLHPTIIRRIVKSFTRGPENGGRQMEDSVCDPFLGGGTTALVCWEHHRQFTGIDLNPEAIRYTMARLMQEHVLPRLARPQLAF